MNKEELILKLIKEDKITLQEALILYQDLYYNIHYTPSPQTYVITCSGCGTSGCNCFLK